MMFDDLSDLYQQVILDHCKHPRNFHDLPHPTSSAQGRNPLCGDQLKLFLVVEGETIKDISFLGNGCCISKASASLLTENLKGKTKKNVEDLFLPRIPKRKNRLLPPLTNVPRQSNPGLGQFLKWYAT